MKNYSPWGEVWEEYEREEVVETLHFEADRWEDMHRLKQYINRLEAERDYYQNASEFAGVPNTPKPELKVLDDWL